MAGGDQIAPAYGYSAVNDREIFLTRDDIHEKFRDFDRIAKKYNVRQTPVYMEFLKGEPLDDRLILGDRCVRGDDKG